MARKFDPKIRPRRLNPNLKRAFNLYNEASKRA